MMNDIRNPQGFAEVFYMAEEKSDLPKNSKQPAQEPQLEGGTYEIIRNRLLQHSDDLKTRLDKLNLARKDVFGAIETTLKGSERISTDNNCVPRDMIALGNRFIFGYNVFIGLRPDTTLADVFAVYSWNDGTFSPEPLELINDPTFQADFKNLYKYYRHTTFVKFAVIGPHLFMVFRVGKDVTDVKTFKWLIREGRLEYLDNRSDHEYVFPAQHEFEWKRATHEMQHCGQHPHVSIEDLVFIDTIGGDLTVKIEDNTQCGEGIFSEPVENADQTLDDAEIYYAVVANTIVMKIRPYQEKDFRYIVYNEKVRQAVRIDSIEDACVLLPEGHGLIFPKGYYLQTGEQKTFENDMGDMIFEKRLSSPNGEDYLYVFYNRESGTYVLLSYNLISQQIATPIICNGYSFFDDGTLIYFRVNGEPQKHHVIQIWQTPYCAAEHTLSVQSDSYLFKIGNKDIVRCMAECTELIILVDKEDTYANLYVDIARKAQDIRDSYFWISDEKTFNLAKPLGEINTTASSAIDEFEKVVRTKQQTAKEIARVSGEIRQIVEDIHAEALEDINGFVRLLAALRAARGQVISLKDLRYCDLETVEALDKEVAEYTDDLSTRCVEFLLQPESLKSYSQRVANQADQIAGLSKVAQARELGEDVSATANELEMLTEIVSNLKIEDATQTTAIIDNISLIFSTLNQVKSSLKNKTRQLGSVEGKAEFTSQIKLIDQSVTNYLDVCDSPEKCDEYLTRVMVQMETLEAKFADFDEFILELAEKREELYNAFESRKIQLVEARNRRASTLMTAGERIIKGIRNRVESLGSINEINGYFASDLMIARLRETIEQLQTLGDSVKADDLQSQLKSIQQDSIRQLKDKQALYEDGENIIRLGSHKFSVNHQQLELTIVPHDDQMCFHLVGTGFFEPITNDEFLATRNVWSLEVLSESPTVYRAEYLAYRMLQDLRAQGNGDIVAIAAAEKIADILPRVQQYMAPRYAEGYVKGVHDHDAANILKALAELEGSIGLLRYPSQARALARVMWLDRCNHDTMPLLAARIAGLGPMLRNFKHDAAVEVYVAELVNAIRDFAGQVKFFDEKWFAPAGEYLFRELSAGHTFAADKAAMKLRERFTENLDRKNVLPEFKKALSALAENTLERYQLIRDWITAYANEAENEAAAEYIDEAAALLLADQADKTATLDVAITRKIPNMVGSHAILEDGQYHLNYCHFMTRLGDHETRIVPEFRAYQKLKKQLVDDFANELRLSEFEPRVLTTFVRNKLIDKVYLPLIGDNLAKQIGTAGEGKRTDTQGMLMLISPPGYGKTTLMEYIANRLGLIFMKINGPAIGNKVTSLDPTEATNAASREEVEKLNLAFEMGDNVMIYLDDIQHCNPEFLQKFISLCDAQRRVEGVYKGRTSTYDLRGKRVCVIMAGNPYTESGEKFRIPDMLSNRADTYNIGDIVGDNYDEFIDSYVENCLTSNPVLGKLANRSQADVYAIMKLAKTGRKDDLEFEGNYSADELNEYVSTMKKLYIVREVVLKVNQQYIKSAGQADDYRTEPPFLLQGSYRNMNRIASRVLPVMNDDELWTLINATYEQDAQTLTTGTESNLLKFREMLDRLSEDEEARWEDIKKTFGRNKLLGGSGEDKLSQVIGQLNAFGAGLDGIRDVIAQGVGADDNKKRKSLAQQQAQAQQQTLATMAENFSQVGGNLDSIRAILADGLTAMAGKKGEGEIGSELQAIRTTLEKGTAALAEAKSQEKSVDQTQAIGQAMLEKLSEIISTIKTQGQFQKEAAERAEALTINDSAQTMVAVLEEQFKTLETWLKPVTKTEDARETYVDNLISRFEYMANGYNHLLEVLRKKQVHNKEDKSSTDTPKHRPRSKKED